MDDDGVNTLDERPSFLLVSCVGEIPPPLTHLVEAVPSVQSLQCLRAHAQGEQHVPAEDFEERDPLSILQGSQGTPLKVHHSVLTERTYRFQVGP